MNLPPENIFGHTKKLAYILDAIGRVVARNPGALIVDYGCGNGEAVGRYIIDHIPPTARYVGVDIHQPSVDHANASFGRSNARFHTSEPNEPADVIVYADVLEHLGEPRLTLCRHADLLKPGGIIVGSIPNGLGPFELESALDRKLRLSERIARFMARVRRTAFEQPPYNSDSGHVQFYRKRPFITMLATSGFRLADFRNGTFFGAMVTERFLRVGGERLMRANSRVADYLPSWTVSTWLFTFEGARRWSHAK
jgi:2-polyprenyl-3-methyl-5-hydroxy-6-metoxy-1,4-benzoquinol methylase